MSQSTFYTETAPRIENTINVVGFCSAIITLSAIVLLVYFRRQILNRITLRFQGLIALIDIARHFYLFDQKYPDGTICKVIAFSIFFLDHMYVFSNVLIALNMQLVYVHDIFPTPIYELVYLTGAFSFALVIDLVPLAFDAYGKDKYGVCFLKNNLANRYTYKLILKYIPLMSGLAYCVISFFIVSSCLYLRSDQLKERFPSKKVSIFGESVNGQKFIKKLYFRIALYPISSVVTFFFDFTANIYFDKYKSSPDWLEFAFQFSMRLTGIINLVSLIIDPHFKLAIMSIYKNGFNRDQSAKPSISLKELGAMNNEEEYLINFPGECIRFEDYIKHL